MAKRQVFFSFHFNNDVMRVQQIRNIGVIEGNTPVTSNNWEDIKRNGEAAIQRWINTNMQNKSCVIVLIGSETASRKWVKYEIKKAWEDGRALLGIYIHNINCPRNGKSTKGSNPFNTYNIDGVSMADIVPCYNPSSNNAYNDIANNIDSLIEKAITIRNGYA